MTNQQTNTNNRQQDLTKDLAPNSCINCAHFFVCDILKATLRFLDHEYAPDRKPFEVENLAQICKQFQYDTPKGRELLTT
jgi:hypothetical protein